MFPRDIHAPRLARHFVTAALEMRKEMLATTRIVVSIIRQEEIEGAQGVAAEDQPPPHGAAVEACIAAQITEVERALERHAERLQQEAAGLEQEAAFAEEQARRARAKADEASQRADDARDKADAAAGEPIGGRDVVSVAQDEEYREKVLGPAGTPRVAVEAGVRAVFGYPLQVGAVRLGALNLYRRTPGPRRNRTPLASEVCSPGRVSSPTMRCPSRFSRGASVVPSPGPTPLITTTLPSSNPAMC